MSRAVGASVAAAGALVWRQAGNDIEVALVHRPRYDDWSWPKGKLDPGEEWSVAAVREVHEETGLQVRLGLPLPTSLYALQRGEIKQVRYWSAEVIGGDGALVNEIDQVAWLTPAQAASRLTHPRDRDQLTALERARRAGDLACWPLLVVRHAEAIGRSKWSGTDRDRPLDRAGRAWAQHLAPILAAYAPHRLISSPARRCMQTLEPYADACGDRIVAKNGLSEEVHEDDPSRSVKHLRRALERGAPVALCTHRPLLPDLLRLLAVQAADNSVAASTLRLLAHDIPAKGEVVVCQMVGTGDAARVVSVEQILPR